LFQTDHDTAEKASYAISSIG
jgi:hypothetical protein